MDSEVVERIAQLRLCRIQEFNGRLVSSLQQERCLSSEACRQYCEETGDFLIPDHRVLEPTKFQLFAEFQRMKKAQTTGCCAIV